MNIVVLRRIQLFGMNALAVTMGVRRKRFSLLGLVIWIVGYSSTHDIGIQCQQMLYGKKLTIITIDILFDLRYIIGDSNLYY